MKQLHPMIVACILLIIGFVTLLWADDSPPREGVLISSSSETLENDIVVVREVYLLPPNARSDIKTAVRTETYSKDGSTIAVISIQGTYYYDGTSVGVVYKDISNVKVYDGWSFSQTSFASRGGKILLTGRLTKNVLFQAVNMSLCCDKNGNLS